MRDKEIHSKALTPVNTNSAQRHREAKKIYIVGVSNNL